MKASKGTAYYDCYPSPRLPLKRPRTEFLDNRLKSDVTKYTGHRSFTYEVYMMGSQADSAAPGEIPVERHAHIRKLLERPAGPFCQAAFEPDASLFDFFSNNAKVLVVGAGGLGCELLKCLSLMGFKLLHVIDMDTIDISNLNRQFLFRLTDVGRSKAETAAAFINKRVQGAQVVAHHCKIQDKDEDFYRGFHAIVCGLDSIVARRWLNSMVMSLLEYDDDGKIKEESIIPIIDGGTEGFKGNARVILPGTHPCIECTLDLYPPQVNFPLCTIANTPRLPEHCIEYVRILQWPKDNPFEADLAIDGDDPTHINWIYEKSLERASQFGITGVTYRLTQGVVKRIIPAVASTNAVIAAACATEVFKLATGCCTPMDNYMVFSDTEGIYTYTYKAERKENCIACSREVTTLEFSVNVTLQQVIDHLKESAEFQMKNPGVTTVIDGKNKTLFTHVIKVTEGNLSKKMTDLGIIHGGIITVADETTPTARDFKITYKNAGME